jgi:hypothetical protein
MGRRKHKEVKPATGLTWRYLKTPIDRNVIAQVGKAWRVTFPDDYVDCAMVNHGATPAAKCFDFPGHREAVFRALLGYFDAKSDNENLSITQMYEAVKDQLPERVYPFAMDPFGNLLCFDYRDSKRNAPTIVFWDHEVDDPEEAIAYVCDTFSELLAKLYEPE